MNSNKEDGNTKNKPKKKLIIKKVFKKKLIVNDLKTLLAGQDKLNAELQDKVVALENEVAMVEDILTESKHNEFSNENENIKLYNGDCNEKLVLIDDGSIQLICIDPPYNIGKDGWDKIDNYNYWLTKIIVKLEKKLRRNGSLFVFHNNIETIAELIISIKKNTELKLVQMITWNKRFDGSKKKKYLDGYVAKKDMYMFNKMCEYILFYVFDNSSMIKKKRLELKIPQTRISSEIRSKTGGLTGWYSNIETGRNHPTKDTIKPIKKHLYLGYDDIVPKFNNQKTHHSVWNYDIAKRNKIHITPKPIDLLENIIKHTTDEGDMTLDCFAGSGSFGKACQNQNRKCILIESEAKYCEFIKNELNLTM